MPEQDYKIRFSIILIIFYLTNNIFAQEKDIRGKIYNDLNEVVCNVEVTIQNTKKYVLSDKKGRFKIKILLNDTLVFSKDKYLIKKISANDFEKKRVKIIYDYKRAIQELENNTENIDFPFGCNPLYVVDGDVEINYNREKKYDFDGLKKKDLNIIILKGIDATEKFGKFASN